jgi:Flp pilus assembly protein CpaB
MPRFRRPRYPALVVRQAAAGVLGLLALLLALRPAPEPAAAGPPRSVPVAVAARDLPPGTALAAADLAVVRLPPDAAPHGAAEEPARLTGRVLASGVRAGEPVTDVRLVGAGLTDLLPADQVAAPVRLADLGVAGLVRTGDRVDVLAAAPDASAAEIVAGGALVLAAPGAVAAEEHGDPGAGLLVVAVDAGTAARLAAAATSTTLTVSLPSA